LLALKNILLKRQYYGERISLFYEVVLYKIDIFGLVGAQIFIENTDNKNFKLSFNFNYEK
jgi:hypothetical protein